MTDMRARTVVAEGSPPPALLDAAVGWAPNGCAVWVGVAVEDATATSDLYMLIQVRTRCSQQHACIYIHILGAHMHIDAMDSKNVLPCYIA